MFIQEFTTNVDENYMMHSDVYTNTKQIKTRDNSKSMSRNLKKNDIKNYNDEERKSSFESTTRMDSTTKTDDKKKQEVRYKENDRNAKATTKQSNERCKRRKSLDTFENKSVLEETEELDLSVPASCFDKENISISRSASSYLVKSPIFFRQPVDMSKTFIENSNTSVKPFSKMFTEDSIDFEEDRPLTQVPDESILSPNYMSSFSLQTDLTPKSQYDQSHYDHTQQYDHAPQTYHDFEHSDPFCIPQHYDLYPSQSNNLFSHSYPANKFNNLYKKRSYSETDISKPNRVNPFLYYRSQTDDAYKHSNPCNNSFIDSRIFYKPISYNKENHIKPAYSYAQIITKALNDSKDGRLSLGEIYKWIENNFEYYKFANPVWKNSIRHNLSLSKCFKKVPREPGTRGKGGKWMIDSEFLVEEENRKRRTRQEEENRQNAAYVSQPEKETEYKYC